MDINLLTAEEKKQLFEDLAKEVEPSETVSALPRTKHIVCSCGFECDLDTSILDDAELLEDLMALNDSNPNVGPILIRLFGEDGKKELYESCRASGRVRISLVYEALYEIFEQMKAKNS